RPVGDDDVSTYEPNDEVDEVRWVEWDKACDLLSYRRDRDLLGHAASVRRKTVPLVVLRHAESVARKAWEGDDRRRPLAPEGDAQTQRLVPLLDAFGVRGIHSSSSVRCVETVRPYADASGHHVTGYDIASEQDATMQGIVDLVDSIVEAGEPAVLCSHRPVLPAILDALRVADPRLETAQLLVVHLRKGRVVSTEEHRASFM